MAINHRFLALARESREWSQSKLSKESGVAQALISQFENGLRQPPEPVLAKLASQLGYPVSLFQQPDVEIPLPLTFHRKHAKLPKRTQDRIHAEMNFAVMQVRRLLRSADLEDDLAIPSISPEEHGSPSTVARALRAHWQVPRGPIEDLAQLLERAGILVVCRDIGTKALQGFSVWPSGMPPLILVNSGMPSDRQRHTLAHELGHMVMHHAFFPADATDVERQADEFAAEFLMPEVDIKPQLYGRIDLARLAALKPVWRVSVASLLYRAESLGVITKRYSRYLWMQLGKEGYRTREPLELDFPAERPRLIRQLFEHHTKELHYTPEDLGSLLHQDAAQLRSFYFGSTTPTKLQVVK